MIITVQDAKDVFGARYCHRGMRAFCRANGIDWSEVVKHGIDAERLRATGDAMAVRLVEATEVKRGRF